MARKERTQTTLPSLDWGRGVSPRTSLRWSYEWQEASSPVTEGGDDLIERIVDEMIERASERLGKTVILVRGDLGVGKTALASVLNDCLEKAAKETRNPEIKRALEQCKVLDAPDTLTANEFATRIVLRALQDDQAKHFVILGRPDYLNEASLALGGAADVVVNIKRFDPSTPVGKACIKAVCAEVGLESSQADKVWVIVSRRLEGVYNTPFWFKQIALLVKAGQERYCAENYSSLLMFEQAAREVLKEQVEDLVRMISAPAQNAAKSKSLDDRTPHFGYVSVIAAWVVLDGRCSFKEVAKRKNAYEAIELLIDHIEFQYRWNKLGPKEQSVISAFESFVNEDDSTTPHIIYVQGILAGCLKRLGILAPSRRLSEKLVSLINARTIDDDDEYSTWWDVSDALSCVGDPRLERARAANYEKNSSGYFTEVNCSIKIGSDFTPRPKDLNLPLLSYRTAEAQIGPMWIANFLVTVEEFQEFFTAPNAEEFYLGTGGQWYRKDPALLKKIRHHFDLTKDRCLAPEIAEQSQGLIPSRTQDRTRQRALRDDRFQVRLWQRTDSRFNRLGNPVVDVTWWEAMAYCEWWTRTKLRDAGFPEGCYVSLPTDWQWEAVRRFYYDKDLPDRQEYTAPRYPAHLRPASVFGNTRASSKLVRVQNLLHPLHVGLSPVPSDSEFGPYDMVGNVWEWTRSKVFAEIKRQPDQNTLKSATIKYLSHLKNWWGEILSGVNEPSKITEDKPTLVQKYGGTIWDDVDESQERDFLAEGRDNVYENDDLGMRVLRGSSFYMDDMQAAWHPAYRICDPPYYSFLDCGFRIAVYPPP